VTSGAAAVPPAPPLCKATKIESWSVQRVPAVVASTAHARSAAANARSSQAQTLLEVDPLLHREGDLRNRWQAVANALFTMRSLRQPVATHSNGFRLFDPILAPRHLPPLATGCNHGAP
jgi:hypothetical protein